ncbi:MAG: NAD-dependent epimerase/dehydratase family protein [Fimbriiglobus sp.]
MSSVLVTGSAGRIGQVVVQALTKAGVSVRGFDMRPTPGLPDAMVGNIADGAQVHAAMAGVRAVIHLAASPDDRQFPRGAAPNDGDNFLSELVPANIIGVYNILEAARKHETSQVVLASTGQTIDGHLDANNIPVTVTASFQPRYLYACTKVFLEAIGQVYSKQHALNILAVRLGWCPRDAGQVAEIAADPECQDVFLSPDDAGSFFLATVTKPWTGHHVVYATSRPLRNLRYDLTPTHKLLDWQPSQSWPTGAEA